VVVETRHFGGGVVIIFVVAKVHNLLFPVRLAISVFKEFTFALNCRDSRGCVMGGLLGETCHFFASFSFFWGELTQDEG